MRTNTLFKILSVFAAISLAGCDVKDPIYNTPHPDKGAIVITADWTRRGEGIAIPPGIHHGSGGNILHPA